ncbi:phytoene desaturase family protein [Gordonia sp. VNQ95]|uniref:phytoene desaturase family protein n=1 Tax=Gordonia TaxID=2053 RepID=UPI0032B3951D
MSDIVVIGAGVGGLAAAIRLQAAGHRVTVLEQSADVGGKLGVLTQDGFVFDTGPSLLTMPQVLAELFADTGAPLGNVLDLQRLPIAARYYFPDGTLLDLPGEMTDIPAALDAALGSGCGAQWQGLLRRSQQIWDVTREPFLESPISLRRMASLARSVSDVRTVAPWHSLRGLGHRYLDDVRLRMMLDRYATYTGSDPRRAPGALLSVPWAEQSGGSWYVRGGLGRIAIALRDRLLELGGLLCTDTEVEAITTSGGRVTGVRTVGGRVVDADLVVANADAEQVYSHLITTPPARRARRSLHRSTPSLSGFVMLLAVDDPPPMTHHTVLFPSDYDAEFDAVFGRHGRPRPVADPTIYITAPDDPAVRPDASTAAWFVLVNAPRHDPDRGMDWDAPGVASRYADLLVDLMSMRDIDIAGRIRHRFVISPSDLQRRTLTPGGSIYGTSSNGPRSAFLRPANRSPVPGLYLVGGSAHPGGGVPLVLLSAKIVAGLIGPA